MDDERRPTVVRVYGWGWGAEREARPGVPWLALFLIVFGALLLLDRVLPAFQFAGSALVLAIGIAFLIRWGIDRTRIGSLYAGVIITALGAPGLLEGLRIVSGPGLGQLCLGIGFLVLAAIRYAASGGVGWQAWIGVILTVLGATSLAEPRIGQFLLPALVLIAGILLLARSARG